MARLRGEGGCPWDLEQTFSTIAPYVIEEAYEVVSAIDSGSKEALKEELGDLLLQVVFLSRLAEEEASFGIGDVIAGSVEKMIRRHPHVFGDATALTSGDVLKYWADIKEAEEKAKKRVGFLSQVPETFPALLRAHKVSKKAAKVGFDWQSVDQVLEKVSEEIAEFREALDDKKKGSDATGAVEEELGDILFAVANVARFVDVDPENALRKTIGKFISRFHYIETKLEERGKTLTEATLGEMEALWQEAKRRKRRKRES